MSLQDWSLSKVYALVVVTVELVVVVDVVVVVVVVSFMQTGCARLLAEPDARLK